MSDNRGFTRRLFLQVSAAAAGAFSFGFNLGPGLDPASVELGVIMDPMLGGPIEPEPESAMCKGRLYGHAYHIVEDLLEQLAAADRKPAAVVIAGEVGKEPVNCFVPSGSEYKGSLEEKMRELGLRLGAREPVAAGLLAETVGGARLLVIERPGSGSVGDSPPIAALGAELVRHKNKPAVIFSPGPLLGKDPGPLGRAERGRLISLIAANPNVAAVICGGALENRAGFIPGGRALCLHVPSPAAFPCGCRTFSLNVDASGSAGIESRFVQTRHLVALEEGFMKEPNKDKALARLGRREDRSIMVAPGHGGIETIRSAPDPSSPPAAASGDSVTLAMLSDTHICLNKFLSEHDSDEYKLIGHYSEEGSKAILEDILGQLSEGRHRLEFFDEYFDRDPDDARHYLEAAPDAVLVTGDLTENGWFEESERFRSMLESLPPRLREKTMVMPGNHDMYNDFSPDGERSDKSVVSGFYDGFGPRNGSTDFVVPLCDWATLISLDTSIPSETPLGVRQDQIDWLEDRLFELKDQAVLISSHHPIYALTLIPPLMNAYLRARAHFTPKRAANRMALQELFARHDNVKLIISGHYHGVNVDRFKKIEKRGGLADDGYTTHIQIPCTVEYPCGYRLLRLSREGNKARIEYHTAFTRLAGLREGSRQAPIFKILGTETRVPPRWQGTMARLGAKDNAFGDLAKLDPYNLLDLNVRGFKDGSAMAGKGKGGKPNINGSIEFTI